LFRYFLPDPYSTVRNWIKQLLSYVVKQIADIDVLRVGLCAYLDETLIYLPVYCYGQ